jgi:hypothetical protein
MQIAHALLHWIIGYVQMLVVNVDAPLSVGQLSYSCGCIGFGVMLYDDDLIVR